MTLEDGKTYITRDGQRVTVAEVGRSQFPFIGKMKDGSYHSWCADGFWLRPNKPDPLDLIAEAPAETPAIPLMALGLLSDEHQALLLKAWQQGTLEGWFRNAWRPSANKPHSSFTYRIKPAPAITKPSIDWSHVAPKWRWLAQDEGGDAFLYPGKPEMDEVSWAHECFHICAEHFASYVPSTCEWHDSLVERPEGV